MHPPQSVFVRLQKLLVAHTLTQRQAGGESLPGSRNDIYCGLQTLPLLPAVSPRTRRGPAGSKSGKFYLSEEVATWGTASSFQDGSPPNLAGTPRGQFCCHGPEADLHPPETAQKPGLGRSVLLTLVLWFHSESTVCRENPAPTSPFGVSSSPSVQWEVCSGRCASVLQNLTSWRFSIYKWQTNTSKMVDIIGH